MTDADNRAAGSGRKMTREEWIDYLVDQAPEISEEQWEETVSMLLALRSLRERKAQQGRDGGLRRSVGPQRSTRQRRGGSAA